MNSRTKKMNKARQEFRSKNPKCLICFQPAVWAHLVGRNTPYKKNDPTKTGNTVPLCHMHHIEYDKNTSPRKRIEFWEKHNFYSVAQKVLVLTTEN